MLAPEGCDGWAIGGTADINQLWQDGERVQTVPLSPGVWAYRIKPQPEGAVDA